MTTYIHPRPGPSALDRLYSEITAFDPCGETTKGALSAWRAVVADWNAVLEVVVAVGELSETAAVSKIGAPRWTADYDALLATFTAWRAFTERGVPADWVLAGEDGGPGVVVEPDHEEEIDF